MPKLTEGQPAPDFTLPDSTGREVSLSDYRGKHLVVFFYPAALTPGCTTEACDFRDSLAPLRAAGYEVVGISPDKPEKQAKFVEKHELTYPLLCDVDRSVMTEWGAYGEKKLYGKTVTGVIRSTVVVAPDGTVELARYNVKATGHVSALTKALGLAA
jgi:peroxiredoxin Q/BCP